MTSANISTGQIRSILAPTDGSSAAREALDRGMQLARTSDAAVHVLTVVDTPQNPIEFGVSEVVELDRAPRRLVDEILEVYDENDVEIHGAVRRGRPANVILSYACEHDIELIVVGKTGRGKVERAILGSTTDQLIRESPIPVIVVPEGN